MKRIRNTDFFKEQYANKSSDEEAYISYRLSADPRPANRAGEPEPGVFGTLEPEPLEKKPGAGAAWKKSQAPEPVKISRLLSPARR